jgi:2-polyprenyl-6-methoxyphenol hydroxylase-like FAD-dependent oxidoreductase
MWLAGDAGHITGPAGMQSMNVGLREADELTGILAAVLRDRAPVEKLQEYSQKRLEEWQFLLGIEGGLAPKPGADPWIGQNAGRLLPCIPASGDDLAALAAQVGLEPK